MPTPVDNLNKNSSKGSISNAISACIEIEMDNGEKQSQAIAMCSSMAEKKTGKDLRKGWGAQKEF
jgi:hypothetical protein